MCQTNNFNKTLMTFPNPTATNQGTRISPQMVMMLIYLPAEVKQKLRQVNEGRVKEENDSVFKLLFAFKYITFAKEAFCENFCISIVLKWFCEKKYQNKFWSIKVVVNFNCLILLIIRNTKFSYEKFQIKSVDW